MYNPNTIRQWRRFEYEGTLGTQNLQFKSTSNTVDVERPSHFVQRANVDIGATLNATCKAVAITVPAMWSVDRVSREHIQRPHRYRDPHFEFPVIKCTESAVYRPEATQQHYEANPKQLYDLGSRILCAKQPYDRLTKMRLTDVVYERYDGVEVDSLVIKANVPAGNYKWSWRDGPAGTLSFYNGVNLRQMLYSDTLNMHKVTQTHRLGQVGATTPYSEIPVPKPLGAVYKVRFVLFF